MNEGRTHDELLDKWQLKGCDLGARKTLYTEEDTNVIEIVFYLGPRSTVRDKRPVKFIQRTTRNDDDDDDDDDVDDDDDDDDDDSYVIFSLCRFMKIDYDR
ncbi:hypothetical protein HZH68_015678 [Vespula germanica]|uniref:Uncharacterized protein n=1 Tax=Vespula germanica TaxID=30212 RepID=A0A834J5D7_VESGE|nr:hypothetical protein HZH68_015678 [Vespula germanica]